MIDKMKISIEIGNDAVQTIDDITDILARVACSVQCMGNLPESNTMHKVLDTNGNCVGHYKFYKDGE